MKVALLNDKLDTGGAEKVLVNMANMLLEKGIDVSVILLLKPSVLDHLINPAIPVFYLHRKSRFDIGSMFRLKKLLKDMDIIHVHSRYNLRYYIVAKLITFITRPVIVFHEHMPATSIDFFTKFCLKKANAYVAVLQSMSLWATEKLGLKPGKVFYLPNIINPPKEKIEQQHAGYKIIMVGNFRHFKNQLFAIELMSALPKEYTLTLYGTIISRDYYEQIEKKIEENHLQNRVKFVKGVSDMYEVIGDFNFAIHSAAYETGPLVLMEYMNAGLPFLTFKTGDVVESIKDELPELIMDSFDVEKWKNAILNIMSSDEQRSIIRDKMGIIIQQKFSEEAYWHTLSNIYQQVLN